mmetsp:Transcript_6839/g.9103  ORF Transcript_6839/g.9103 Transcript_6839/m.9103 type:complete len:106 (+) Transcript_6839:256-573(+)
MVFKGLIFHNMLTMSFGVLDDRFIISKTQLYGSFIFLQKNILRHNFYYCSKSFLLDPKTKQYPSRNNGRNTESATHPQVDPVHYKALPTLLLDCSTVQLWTENLP